MNHNTTIVFITYQSALLIENFLSDLGDYPIIVIDNNSSDGTCENIQKNHPKVQVICNNCNAGYGRAANIAFKQVKTKYALLVNPDAQFNFETVKALEELIPQTDNRWLFIAPHTGLPPKLSTAANMRNTAEGLAEASFAGGAALLFNLSSFNELQGFDENIFLYYEETDLCKRAQANNIKMYYADNIIFVHEGGQSSKSSEEIERLKLWHFQWSSLYFAKKHKQQMLRLEKIFKALFIYPIKLRLQKKGSRRRMVYECRTEAAIAHLKGHKAFINEKTPFNPSINYKHST